MVYRWVITRGDVQGFIEGSVNVPLYQPIEGWDAYNIARRVGYLAFGVLEGTEANPNFMEGVWPFVTMPAALPLHPWLQHPYHTFLGCLDR